MFKIFKRKPKHIHAWEKVDSYFDHILTEYTNMGDSVLIYNLEKCALCKRERKVLIDERTTQ